MNSGKKIRVRVEVSARHLHLSKRHLEKLFGVGYKLTPFYFLSQTGQFAAKETVKIKTPKNKLICRIVGPARSYSQIELSRTDCFFLGIEAPLRVSGEVRKTKQIEVRGPKGQVRVPVIIPVRHLHCSPDWAQKKGLRKGQKLKIRVGKERKTTYENVIVRVHASFVPRVHLDTDEGNAAFLSAKSFGYLYQ